MPFVLGKPNARLGERLTGASVAMTRADTQQANPRSVLDGRCDPARAVLGHVRDIDDAADKRALIGLGHEYPRVRLFGESADVREQLVVVRLLLGCREALELGVDLNHELAEGVELGRSKIADGQRSAHRALLGASARWRHFDLANVAVQGRSSLRVAWPPEPTSLPCIV